MLITQYSCFVEKLGDSLKILALGKRFARGGDSLFCGIAKKGRQNPKLTPTSGDPGLKKVPFSGDGRKSLMGTPGGVCEGSAEKAERQKKQCTAYIGQAH